MEYLGRHGRRHRAREGRHHQARRPRGDGRRRRRVARSCAVAPPGCTCPSGPSRPSRSWAWIDWGCVSTTPCSASFAWGSSADTRRPTRRWRWGSWRPCDEAGIADAGPAAIRSGLAATRWPGRLELLTLATDGGSPAAPAGPAPRDDSLDILLDGAHNTAGAAALAAALEELRPHLRPGRVTLLLGIMRDKEVLPMLEALRSIARPANCPGAHHGRARQSPRPGRRRARHGLGSWRVAGRARPTAALDAALDAAAIGGRAARGRGSLYLVGHVRGRLIGRVVRHDARPSPGPMTHPGPRCSTGAGAPTSWASSTSRPIRSAAMGCVDGGRSDAAVRQARRMVDEGADLLDMGGESTRPGHAPVHDGRGAGARAACPARPSGPPCRICR